MAAQNTKWPYKIQNGCTKYQMAVQNTKWPYKIQNGRTKNQTSVKYIKNFYIVQELQKYKKIRILGKEYMYVLTIWQPKSMIFSFTYNYSAAAVGSRRLVCHAK
jgi:hypothetical protein